MRDADPRHHLRPRVSVPEMHRYRVSTDESRNARPLKSETGFSILWSIGAALHKGPFAHEGPTKGASEYSGTCFRQRLDFASEGCDFDISCIPRQTPVPADYVSLSGSTMSRLYACWVLKPPNPLIHRFRVCP